MARREKCKRERAEIGVGGGEKVGKQGKKRDEPRKPTKKFRGSEGGICT